MTTPPRRTWRALAASVLLVAALAGAPILLTHLAPVALPTRIPTWEEITAALVRPDNGALLISTLRVAAWACWAAFTTTTLVDLAARARHTRVPHLPLLGWLQHATAGLVTTAALLLTTPAASQAPATGTDTVAVSRIHDRAAPVAGVGVVDPAMTVPAAVTRTTAREITPVTAAIDPAMTPTPTAVTGPKHAAATDDTAPAPAPAGVAYPTVTVQRGDSLWELAERHLGDGARYTEIADLNRGLPQPDGRALSDEHWIYPGWILRLPTDATHTDPDPAATAPPEEYTVRPGDTLWDIAETQLGDGHLYPQIFDTNRGAPQPDGQTLTDPDLIRPGWTLHLSTTAPAAEPATPAAIDAVPTQRGTAQPPTFAVDPPSNVAPEATPAPPVHATPPAGAEVADVPLDTEDRAFPGGLLAGLTALAAAGITGELARRRHLRHRTRRTGQRLPMPAPGSPQAALERDLRATTTPLSISELRTALAHLAAHAYTTGTDQPPIAALELAAETLTAHLTEPAPAPPPAPWQALTPTTWTAPVADLKNLATPDDPDAPEPYPALATLGHTTTAVVLVNLEAAGTLTITGPDQTTAPVLNALVAELVTNELTGRIGLATGPTYAPLAAVCDPARIHVMHAPTSDHRGRARQVRSALAECGSDDTLQARSDRSADDTWLPVIYVATPDDPAPTTPAEPWSGSVLLTADTQPLTDWSLEVTEPGAATLRPIGLSLTPQHLTDDQIRTLADTLAGAGPATAARQTPRPAPHVPTADQPLAAATAALAALPSPRAQIRAAMPANVEDDLDEYAVRPMRINVLGPVEITGLPDSEDPLGAKQIELLAYLALHGKATAYELDDALWPGRRVDRQTRNSFIYRTRAHVGRAQLPVKEGDHYALGAHVRTDWDEFTELARLGLTAGPAGAVDLRAALALVRNRPFVGIDPRTYTWADPLIQEMTATIADVAHCLATLRTTAGDHTGAAQAAAVGLLVEPTSEQLQHDALDTALARNDLEGARWLIERRNALLTALDPDEASSADRHSSARGTTWRKSRG